MSRWASLVLGALLGSGVAAAATAPPDTAVVPVPGIEVTALRGRDRLRDIPAAAFVLSRDDIRRAGSARLSTLLQAVPGLYAYGQTSSGDATIVDPRGFSANGERSYLKLLVDGQDVRDLENGNVDWDWVAPGDIDRIEVVQGPGAWVYGDASEGGIVNVVRSPLGDEFASRFDARAGSFGLGTGSLSLSGPAGAARLGANGSIRHVDGWRDRSRERVYGGGGRATAGWGSRVLSVDASGLDADRENPGYLTPAAFAADPALADSRIDGEHSRRGHFTVRLQSAAGPEPRWALTPSVRVERVEQVRTLFAQPLDHETRGTTAGTTAEWRGRGRLGGCPTTLTGEVEGEVAALRSDYRTHDANSHGGALLERGLSARLSGAASATARIELDDRTVARLSVRGDLARLKTRDERAGTESAARTLRALSPLVGISRQVGAAANLYASASTAFRVPSLYQVFDRRPIFVAPNVSVNISNGELDPQRATSAEAGARWSRPDGASAQCAAYSTWVRDEIDFDLATLRYANISRSWHRGVEVSAAWPLPGNLTASAGGAWTPTTVDVGPTKGRQINSVPLGVGSASLAWAPVSAVSAQVGTRVIGRQFLDKDEREPLGAVTAWDAGLEARAGRVRAGVRVTNLFDRRYADSGYVDPIVGVQLLPAAPRSVNVTLSFE